MINIFKYRILIRLISNNIQILLLSSQIQEEGHVVLNKLNRRAQHITGFRANSSRYESEDILVSDIIHTFSLMIWHKVNKWSI